MLRYCAWCDKYLGAKPGEGHQIRPNRCEVDTASICPACRERHLEETSPLHPQTRPVPA